MDLRVKKLTRSLIIFVLVILFFLINILMKNTVPPEYVLDLQFHYTAVEAYLRLELMGQELRDSYMKCLLIFDMLYMVIYTLLVSRTLLYLWGHQKLDWVCMAVLFSDFLENISVLYLLNTFPVYSFKGGFLASFFTTTKWVFVGMIIMLLLGGLFRTILGKIGKSTF